MFAESFEDSSIGLNAGAPAGALAAGLRLQFINDEIQKKSDADLKKVITADTCKMKAVTGTTPENIDNVVAYLKETDGPSGSILVQTLRLAWGD